MKKSKILIPEPASKFVRVKCNSCANEQVVFDHSSTTVKCSVCGTVLSEPRGGKADLKAKVIGVLG